jgi:hypothetical protein
MTGIPERICKKPLDDIKEKRGYGQLKQEALLHIL